jgi:hypothetical protein
VTQWEVVGCASKISEQYLMPVLEAILHQFPFVIVGFHADNGSEYINHTVAKLLEKLLIDFTKSRAYRTQDNALVEGKNGAIIRKYIGYGHIPSEHAELVQKFYTAHFNRHLNFHRPCGFATVSLDVRGKRIRKYKLADYATPYETLKSLPDAEKDLKPGTSWAQLDRTAGLMSDTESARKLVVAKAQLLRTCKVESPVSSPVWLTQPTTASRGNDGPAKSVENQNQVSHPFHRSLEISQKRRDCHISTAPALSSSPWFLKTADRRTVDYGKVEIQEQDSHFPTAPTACGARNEHHLRTNSNRAEKDTSHRRRLSISVSSCIGMKVGFSIILGLENAPRRKSAAAWQLLPWLNNTWKWSRNCTGKLLAGSGRLRHGQVDRHRGLPCGRKRGARLPR